MKKAISLCLFCMVLIFCKQTTKVENKAVVENVKTTLEPGYPEVLEQILEAHGGLSTWKKQQTISFEISKNDILEKHTTDLKTRFEKIELPSLQMGFDGDSFWLLDPEENYKGNPIFYHNLMFYFYAMPFVLADKGIQYNEAEQLEFEGKSYPGLAIRYDDGVGVSSKDEYFIHYNPETYQMEWLGYTVTYQSQKRSTKINWIRYNDWMTLEKLKLPKSLSWFESKDGMPLKLRNTLLFENVSLTTSANTNSFYQMPQNAKAITQ